MRVLIVKLSAFGDIIHSLSVLDYFKEYSEENFTGVELHWLIEKEWSPILKDHPGVHNIIQTNTKRWRKSPFSRETRQEISAFWSRLRGNRYDLVIDINGLIRSAVLARITRAGLRIGFSEDSAFSREKYSSYLLDRTFSVPSGHVVDQTIGLLERALGMKIGRTINPCLPLNNKAASGAKRALARKGLLPDRFAIITAGGGWETKMLDADLVAKFCDYVDQHGVRPVLSWQGETERKRVEDITRFTGCEVKEIGNLPVDVFIEVLRLARIVVGPDTGTVHAASAVETPTVSYYGPSSAGYSGPRRRSDRALQISPSCGPCFKRTCDKELCHRLSIAEVLDEIHIQLGK